MAQMWRPSSILPIPNFNSNFHLGRKHQTMTLGTTDILCSNKKPGFQSLPLLSTAYALEFHARCQENFTSVLFVRG